jgi:hypothetical protein
LTAGEPTFEELLAISPLKKSRLRVVLSYFAAHGLVSVAHGRYRLVRPDLEDDELATLTRRFEARDAADRDRQARMTAYAESSSCRWRFILDALGDESAETMTACGRCDRCIDASGRSTAIAS